MAEEVTPNGLTRSLQNQINKVKDLISKKKLNEAETVLASIKTRIEPESEAFFLEARIQQEQKKNTDALASYSIAIYLNPRMSKAWINRALTRGALRDFEGAIQDLNTAAELDINNTAVYVNRGVTFASLNKPELALSDFNKALSIRPDNRDALHNRGIIFYLEGRNADACNDWRKAVLLGSEETKEQIKSICKTSRQQAMPQKGQQSEGARRER